jgi:GntR family transcriptional regulator
MGRLRRPKHRIPKSDEIRSAFALAAAEAHRLNNPYVGTEHVLMGIARLSESRGAVMLTHLGKNPEEVLRETERLALLADSIGSPGNDQPRSDPMRPVLTPGAMRAVDAAYAEVDTVGGAEIGSDFMIVGLLVEGRGIAAKVLTQLGITLDAARAYLDTGRSAPRTAPPPRERRPRSKPWSRPDDAERRSSLREADELRKVIASVKDEARRLGAAQHDTEHFLLALAHTPESDGAQLLRRLGVDLDAMAADAERAALSKRANAGPPPNGPLPYSGAIMRAVRAARLEWKVSRRELMDSTHMLLGLLLEGTGTAASVLARCGVTLERVRSALSQSSGAPRPAFQMQIDDRSELSIYEQIIARIQEAIATGVLEPGDRLPPVRQLADNLDIAPGTVARAYSELEARGVVITEGARGTRIADQDRSGLSSDARRATLIELLRPVAVEAFHLGASATELHAALDVAARDIRPERGAA